MKVRVREESYNETNYLTLKLNKTGGYNVFY